MLALSLLFIVLSYLKYEKKAVRLIRNLNTRLSKMKGNSVDNPHEAAAKDQKIGKIEKLYKGEIAYLRELKQSRERASRREKLTGTKKHLYERAKTYMPD